MKIGGNTTTRLTRGQARLLGAVCILVLLVVILSGYSALSYHTVKAVVVGNTVELSSRSEGRVAEILVRANDTFRAGDPLARLENPALESERLALEREVAELRQTLEAERSEAGQLPRVIELESSFAEVQSKLAAARYGRESLERIIAGLEATHNEAHARLQRALELVAQGAMTQTELAERRDQANRAEREYQSALQEQRVKAAEVASYSRLVRLHRERMASLESDRTGMIHDLEQTLSNKERELTRMQGLHEELVITAEHDGLVTALRHQEGEFVPAGEAVLSVMTADDLWVEAYLRPSDKQSVRPGNRVVVVDPSGNAQIEGEVERILPVLRSFPVASALTGSDRNYAVVVVVLDDPARARTWLSPAQLVDARIRRHWLPIAAAEAPPSGGS